MVAPALQVQASAEMLAAGELLSALQLKQVVTAVAPSVLENFPATQSTHAALPTTVLYVPAAHCVHAPPDPVYPLSQTQASGLVLPVPVVVLSVGQLEHTAKYSVLSLYFPATHAAQGLPFKGSPL